MNGPLPELPGAYALPSDRMTSAERIAAVRDPARRPDRVPVIPRIYGYAMGLSGWDVADVYCDAERSFVGRLRAQELIGYDDPFALYAYASMGSWEFGGDVKMPAGEYATAPSITRYPVASEDDLERLRLPDDVLEVGSVPIMLEFARLQARHGLPVSFDAGSVFTDTANVVEPTLFFKWLIKRPDLAHHCLRLVTEFFAKMAEAWARLFPGRVIVGFDGTPGEANTLISPQQFQEFALPYLREVHERALHAGVTYFHTHVCGDQNGNLPFYADVEYGIPGEPGMVSFAHEVDLGRALESMGEKVVIMGNVDPSELRFGSAERVFQLGGEAVRAGRDAPLGFALMSGCEVSVGTPPYNLLALIRAAQAYGQY